MSGACSSQGWHSEGMVYYICLYMPGETSCCSTGTLQSFQVSLFKVWQQRAFDTHQQAPFFKLALSSIDFLTFLYLAPHHCPCRLFSIPPNARRPLLLPRSGSYGVERCYQQILDHVPLFEGLGGAALMRTTQLRRFDRLLVLVSFVCVGFKGVFLVHALQALVRSLGLDEDEVFTPFTNSSFYSPDGLEATAPVFSASSFPELPSPLGQVT
eukprot:6203145-Pleurochrysis_carterae.AAC.1